MADFPNFGIGPNGEISSEFLLLNIADFQNAASFVANLPYGRNADKNDLKTLFTDNCGTCSTKHAVLKLLADENNFDGLKLMLGVFRMNGKNTPAISKTLKKYNLEFIPEAHNYLEYKSRKLDFTNANSSPADFEDDLMVETEILPNQISGFKVNFHRKFLQDWLDGNHGIKYSIEELWKIREQCIADLSAT